ncbi:hypothetical protein SEVIR_1G283600v4 [Setaria viridis]|uniref:Uncharacterized protein n=2 Tax=Setaria TaxID=4554 RepID=A0A368PS82_SETIT|nr:hypothetical protein SETIT_1G278100v2 [Setaria italica]TKW40983.1 hypothetical protein SEVIR_1G283600v2 [Setaria viridis]
MIEHLFLRAQRPLKNKAQHERSASASSPPFRHYPSRSWQDDGGGPALAIEPAVYVLHFDIAAWESRVRGDIVLLQVPQPSPRPMAPAASGATPPPGMSRRCEIAKLARHLRASRQSSLHQSAARRHSSCPAVPARPWQAPLHSPLLRFPDVARGGESEYLTDSTPLGSVVAGP